MASSLGTQIQLTFELYVLPSTTSRMGCLKMRLCQSKKIHINHLAMTTSFGKSNLIHYNQSSHQHQIQYYRQCHSYHLHNHHNIPLHNNNSLRHNRPYYQQYNRTNLLHNNSILPLSYHHLHISSKTFTYNSKTTPLA